MTGSPSSYPGPGWDKPLCSRYARKKTIELESNTGKGRVNGYLEKIAKVVVRQEKIVGRPPAAWREAASGQGGGPPGWHPSVRSRFNPVYRVTRPSRLAKRMSWARSVGIADRPRKFVPV